MGQKLHRSAHELAGVVLDPGSFVSWDEPVQRPADMVTAYAAELDAAERASGVDEVIDLSSRSAVATPEEADAHQHRHPATAAFV